MTTVTNLSLVLGTRPASIELIGRRWTGSILMMLGDRSLRFSEIRGRAVVFESIEDYHARIDDPNLDVDCH